MTTQTKESQSQLTPDKALQLLKEGNERFVKNSKKDRDLLQQVNETSTGQYPFAVVLSCIDSRVPAEIIFDQGIGDIFSARVAGNFVNQDILGSMEFACKVAGSKLVVVLGHTSCGAVKGACDDVKLGNLTDMLANLKPAVDGVEVDGERNSKNAQFVQKVADKNVELTIEQIKKDSPVLKEMLDEGDIDIVGGMYDVTSGKVSFY
ncbi:MAG: carbonic anhydrase family protein [Fulvivirga sp.]|nr:carbonic anhydrase family protein [Fulvivirga sp.]